MHRYSSPILLKFAGRNVMSGQFPLSFVFSPFILFVFFSHTFSRSQTVHFFIFFICQRVFSRFFFILILRLQFSVISLEKLASELTIYSRALNRKRKGKKVFENYCKGTNEKYNGYFFLVSKVSERWALGEKQ